jgi:hypothetical protein
MFTKHIEFLEKVQTTELSSDEDDDDYDIFEKKKEVKVEEAIISIPKVSKSSFSNDKNAKKDGKKKHLITEITEVIEEPKKQNTFGMSFKGKPKEEIEQTPKLNTSSPLKKKINSEKVLKKEDKNDLSDRDSDLDDDIFEEKNEETVEFDKTLPLPKKSIERNSQDDLFVSMDIVNKKDKSHLKEANKGLTNTDII